ncbi:MAG TPA: FTR1 family protein [Steroidobacteraceae bacterium]|nr:FTR1 family protein [Steroidobacteraceae bacterium]
MLQAFIIVLREVLEASLIIGIVLAASRGVPRRGLWVLAGVAAGVVGSMVVAAFAEGIAMALEGVGQEIFNAGVLLLATVMLGWHNVWMKSHGRELSQQMKSVGQAVSAGVKPLSMLLIVVGLAVLREGSEVVLFLYGIAAGGTTPLLLWVGSLLGLAGGAALGALMYFGLLRIPTRHLFTVTSWMILLLAAGMASQAAGYLVQAGVLPGLIEPLWNSSSWLPEGSAVGAVLHALIGYDDQPSAMQLIFFAITFVVIAALMHWVDRRATRGTITNSRSESRPTAPQRS